ncbi:MAG: ion channel [Cyanobacteria bacterium P01_F01_bin.33]
MAGVRQQLLAFKWLRPLLRAIFRSATTQRLIEQDRQLNIVRINENRQYLGDLYHLLLTISWQGFLLLVFLLYIFGNALFAGLYLLGGDCIANAEPGSFKDAFFFSVQTMASLGYGAMHPTTTYANLLVTVESLVGLLGMATGTGLMFARVARPTARVMFSRVVVVADYDGIPTLMFRTANQRRNQIIEAQITVTLIRNELTREGISMRRLYPLRLVRSQTPAFALPWVVMHPIDSASPLYGLTQIDWIEREIVLVVGLTGLDETFAQTIHARHVYQPLDIVRDACFVDIMSPLPDGRRLIDYRLFHEFEPIPERLPSATASQARQHP